MRKPRTTLIALALAAGLLAGCDRASDQKIVFDGTEKGLREAVTKLAQERKEQSRAVLMSALDTYLEHLKEDAPATLDTAAPIESLSGISVRDFLSQAEQIKSFEAPVSDSQYPVWTNGRRLEVMQLELQALENNRQSLNRAGHFTLDQLAFNPPSFIPPPEGEVRVAENRAIFAFRMSNETGLAIYRPTFRVRVQLPGEEMPVYSGELTWNDPVGIPDGTSRLIDLSCCSILKEPYLNKRMRQLQETAQISVELVSVEDYRKRNPLRTTGYTTQDYQREQDLKACARDVQSRMDSWTPKRSVPACKRLARNTRSGSQQLSAAIQTVSNRIR